MLMSGCIKLTGADPKLPEEYCGTFWECADPYMVFAVDDKGYCSGTLFVEGVSIPASFNFIGGRSCSIIAKREDVHPLVFSGNYKFIGDVMIWEGSWNGFLEEYFGVSYGQGECTMIFERKVERPTESGPLI